MPQNENLFEAKSSNSDFPPSLPWIIAVFENSDVTMESWNSDVKPLLIFIMRDPHFWCENHRSPQPAAKSQEKIRNFFEKIRKVKKWGIGQYFNT